MASALILAAPQQNSIMTLLQATPLSTVQSIGAVPTSYEAAFDSYAQKHWDATGAAYAAGGSDQGEAGGNYYDRAKIYYREWARTGVAAYKTRADAHVLDFITNYLDPKFTTDHYSGSFVWQWSLPAGLYIYWKQNLVSSPVDALRARDAIRIMADTATVVGWKATVVAPSSPSDFMDTRVQARVLQAVIWAKYSGVTSSVGANYTTDASDLLTGCLARQDSDGANRNFGGSYHNKAFMVGIWIDALVDYLTFVGSDSRIAPAIKAALDYLTANHWDSRQGGFRYLDGFYADETAASAELNILIAGQYWWYYSFSGDTTYRDMGDRAFIEAVNMNDWSNGIGGGKQFNEHYSFLSRYWGFRGNAPMVNASLNRFFYPFNLLSTPPARTSWTFYGATMTDLGAGAASDGIGRAYRFAVGGTSGNFLTRPWSGNIKGRWELHARKAPSGGATSPGVYYTITDDSAHTFLGPTKWTLPSDGSWATVEIADTVLKNIVSTTEIILSIYGAGDSSVTGNIDIDGIYLGVGSSERVEPIVPLAVRSAATNNGPVISGTVSSGNTLSCTTGSWDDASGATYAYQWCRNGVPIAGATSTTRVLAGADVGKYMCCRVISTNSAGSSTPIRSNILGPVT